MDVETLKTIWRWLVPNDAPVVINYSGGNASGYAIRAMIAGVLPRPSNLLVVFADTGSEKLSTYPHVDAMESLCGAHGIEFRRCSAWGRAARHPSQWEKAWRIGDGVSRVGVKHKRGGSARIGHEPMPLDTSRAKLHVAILALPMFPPGSRLDQPPVFVDSGGSGGRVAARCTRHWKIRPMARVVKSWLSTLRARVGVGHRIGVERSRMAVSPLAIRWIGYTSDESDRVITTTKHKQDFEGWLRYPAIAMNKRRSQVEAETVAWGYELAPWSACTVCPHDDADRIQKMDPEDFAVKQAADEALRDASAIGITDGPCYLSSQMIPVAEVRVKGRLQLSLPGLSPCGGGFCIS